MHLSTLSVTNVQGVFPPPSVDVQGVFPPSSIDVQGVFQHQEYERAGWLSNSSSMEVQRVFHRQQYGRALCTCLSTISSMAVHLRTVYVNAGKPDCPASGQSGSRKKKNADA